MQYFRQQLEAKQTSSSKARRWIFLPYDQLTDEAGPLSHENPGDVGIILVENEWSMRQRPYHKQKLALMISNMRHFALEQAARGVAVRYLDGQESYGAVLSRLIPELGRIDLMEPAEYELRKDLEVGVSQGKFNVLQHEGWLTDRSDFLESQKSTMKWRMDRFYRFVRKKTGYLMEEGKPLGGKYSFDAENREFWKGEPPAATPPVFSVNAITEEVGELVSSSYADHPGKLSLETIPASRQDSLDHWDWVKKHCLPYFGPFEDAMSVRSTTIFHSRISSILNLHRLLPRTVIEEVLALNIPLQSKEGFLRQILGWREFVFHVHHVTEGFRTQVNSQSSTQRQPGDGGYSRWKGRPWDRPRAKGTPDGGVDRSDLGSSLPLPLAYWGQSSGLYCLDRVVRDVWEEAYSHHITRLMILSNLATLLEVRPRELADWFWIAYSDAFDWVVEPNVLGMGTFSLGDLFTTKPYVSGTPYINRMSDYCRHCRFDPKSNCPVSNLYWSFLERHTGQFKDNQRMTMMMRTLSRQTPQKRHFDQEVFEVVREFLDRGKELTPELLPEQD